MVMAHHLHPAELSLDCCIKCNICTSACPVSAVTDLFPGPKYAGPQAGRFRQPDQPTPDHSVDYCSGCRVCNMVCPSGVKIAEMNARARAAMVQQGKVSWRLRLRNNLIARSELLGKLGQPVAPLANLLLSNGLVRQMAELTLGIAREAPLPTFAHERFTRWFRSQRDTDVHHMPPTRATRRVVYFHGCSTEYYEPRVGRAAVHVLEHNGFEVIVPPQNCCGLPLLSNGEFKAARAYHQNNVRHLVEYARQGVPIVGTSTSCILTLKEEAPELLDMFDDDTQLVARQSFDLHEFLLGLLEEGTLRTDFRPIALQLPYHPPCQYRAHRLGQPAAEIMALIPELRIVESHAACCGIGGTYGYKVEKYDIAMQVGQSLFDFVEQVGGPLVVCDSETCRWQITHGTGKPAVHPVELLALAYGYPPEGALAKMEPGC
jgi:glycerol-3-phosphate dehydrogenase subunit C